MKEKGGNEEIFPLILVSIFQDIDFSIFTIIKFHNLDFD